MEGSNFGFKGISPEIGVALAVVSGSAFILALLRYYRHCSRQKAMVEPPPNPQSVEVEGTDGARRSALTSEIISSMYPDVTTVYEGFLRGMSVSNDGPCLGTRNNDSMQYTWLSYSQVKRQLCPRKR